MPSLGDEKDSRARYQRFLERVPAAGEVWGLQSEEGWCQSTSTAEGPDSEDRPVMPFWSDRALAAACARDEWSSYAPASIELAEFAEAWLPGMAADGVLVGVNWNLQLVGSEVEPAQLAEDLGLDPGECEAGGD